MEICHIIQHFPVSDNKPGYGDTVSSQQAAVAHNQDRLAEAGRAPCTGLKLCCVITLKMVTLVCCLANLNFKRFVITQKLHFLCLKYTAVLLLIGVLIGYLFERILSSYDEFHFCKHL